MFPWDVDIVTRDTTEWLEWLMTGMGVGSFSKAVEWSCRFSLPVQLMSRKMRA